MQAANRDLPPTRDNPAPGSLYHRVVEEDDIVIAVYPMTFGKARLIWSRMECLYSIEDGYCYEDPRRAIEAAQVWSGEGDPLDGWHRHVTTGRRRVNGDPATEHVYW